MYHRSKPKAGKVSKGMIGIHQISVLPMISKISFLPVSLGLRVIGWIFSSGKPPLWRRQYPDVLNSRALQPSNAQFRSPTPVSVGVPLWRMRNYGYPMIRWWVNGVTGHLYAKSLFDLGAKAIDIIEKLIRNTTEKDSVIVIKSDWGKPPVAIIETPNETYPETNIASSVLKTIFGTSLGSSGLA